MSPLIKILKIIFLFPIALLFAIISVTLMVLLYIPLLFLSIIYKAIILLIAKFVFPQGKVLGALENILANGKVYTDRSMYMSLNLILEGRLDLEAFIENWEEKIMKQKLPNGELRYPELKCFVETWMGYSFYVRDQNFNLRNHFALYDNKNLPVDRKKYNQIRKEEINNLFPEKQSPWKILIIHNYKKDDDSVENIDGVNQNGKEYSVMIFTYHHCLADGYATLKLLYQLFDFEIKPLAIPEIKYSNFIHQSAVFILSFFHFVFLLGEIPFYLIYSPLSKVFDLNTWHQPIKQSDLDFVFWAVKPFQTDVVKDISIANNVTISAVLMAAGAGAFSRLMEAKFLKPPKRIYTAISFNLPNPPDGLRSHSFGVRFGIPLIGDYKTCKEKLAIINRNMNMRIRLGGTVFAPLSILILRFLPVAFKGEQTAKLLQTMNFSSVPLPSDDVILSGCKLVGSYINYEITEFNNSFLMSCLKYKNEFFVSYGIQRTILSGEDEVQDIEKYLYEELQSLRSHSLTV